MHVNIQLAELFERIASQWRLLYHSPELDASEDTPHTEPEAARRRRSNMFQQCIIVGNLGADPEMRYTPAGKPVTNFRVAVNRKWTNQDGSPGEETTWFRVACWGRLAETTNQYLSKGRQVMVVGRVSASAWTSQEGEARASLELTAQDVKFLSGGTGQAAGGQDFPSEEEEIPF